jgi:hypothetical protein
MNAQYLMVGRTFSYRSRSISIGPITISNANLIESDVIPGLNKESFRTWQCIRLPRGLGGDRNDVSAFRVYSALCLDLWCLWKYWPDEGRKNFKIKTQCNWRTQVQWGYFSSNSIYITCKEILCLLRVIWCQKIQLWFLVP